MSTILELEQRDIELQLEEISLKRRQIEIEREQLNEENAPVSVPAPAPVSEVRPQCYLHYSNSVQENHMKIADENVKSWKRELDLLNDKIRAEKYRINLLLGVL